MLLREGRWRGAGDWAVGTAASPFVRHSLVAHVKPANSGVVQVHNIGRRIWRRIIGDVILYQKRGSPVCTGGSLESEECRCVTFGRAAQEAHHSGPAPCKLDVGARIVQIVCVVVGNVDGDIFDESHIFFGAVCVCIHELRAVGVTGDYAIVLDKV